MKRYSVKFKDGTEKVYEYPEGYYMYYSGVDRYQLRVFHGDQLESVFEDVLEFRITRISDNGEAQDFGPITPMGEPGLR